VGKHPVNSAIATCWKETSGGLQCNHLMTTDNNSSGLLWLCLAKLKCPMDEDPTTSVPVFHPPFADSFAQISLESETHPYFSNQCNFNFSLSSIQLHKIKERKRSLTSSLIWTFTSSLNLCLRAVRHTVHHLHV